MCQKAVQPGAALCESLFIGGYRSGADLHPVPVKTLRALYIASCPIWADYLHDMQPACMAVSVSTHQKVLLCERSLAFCQ